MFDIEEEKIHDIYDETHISLKKQLQRAIYELNLTIEPRMRHRQLKDINMIIMKHTEFRLFLWMGAYKMLVNEDPVEIRKKIERLNELTSEMVELRKFFKEKDIELIYNKSVQSFVLKGHQNDNPDPKSE